MKAITGSLHYIGADDPNLDLFESQYKVPEGMCYNSYILLDQQVAVFDTIDARCGSEWKSNLQKALEGRLPDYLIVHHLEPDHSALIAWALGNYPDLKIVCSAKAQAMLPQFFENVNLEGRVLTVKDGDTLSLGAHTLHFFTAAMVHWPEVIVSYDDFDKTLFSADGFGKFGVYDADADDWACEARRYYFNICGKYGMQVQALLKKAAPLDIQRICPLHGPVLEGEKMTEALRLYNIWSKYEVETEGTLIAYASIHGGTKYAAEFLAGMLESTGEKVVLSDLTRSDMAEVIEDAFRYGRMVVAASSYDADVFPPMHEFLHKLQLKGYQNRRVAIVENGSWAPTAGKAMKAMLETMKNVTVVEPTVTIRSRMKAEDVAQFAALADALLAE